MRLLLDTHILLWSLAGSDKLPIRARELIEANRTELFASTVSVWEIAIKYALRRGHADDMPMSGSQILEDISEAGLDLLAITGTHAAAVDSLPLLHGDPFDRLLIAQARSEAMPLLTHDKAIARYESGIVLA